MGELNARQRKQKEAFSLFGFNSMGDGIQWDALLGLINMTLSTLIRKFACLKPNEIRLTYVHFY
jgi:hypothetical protein